MKISILLLILFTIHTNAFAGIQLREKRVDTLRITDHINSFSSKWGGGGYYQNDNSGSESGTVDPSYAERANGMRAEGVEIFRKAAQKTGDRKFTELADSLERAEIVAGSYDSCRDRSAYTYAGVDTIYMCDYGPYMHTLLHETVHTIQVEDGRGIEIECEADYYMIKALYYGAGEIQDGAYDDQCPDNVRLRRSL